MTGEFFICGSVEIEIIVNFTIGKSDCKEKDEAFENPEKPCIIENYDEEAIYNDCLCGDFLWRAGGTG